MTFIFFTSPSTPLGSNTIFFIGSNGSSTISGQDVNYSYGYRRTRVVLIVRIAFTQMGLSKMVELSMLVIVPTGAKIAEYWVRW